MLRRRLGQLNILAASFAAVAACCPHSAGASQSSSDLPPPVQVTLPRISYRLTTLPNGLRVITLEDHRAPVVTVEVWYHVGSKDEAPGKAGFAHLFEHLMFKGSAHVGPQGHARYIEQVGGHYNADTSYDRTRFYETVPANALDRVLWLEADRMASLRVDQANMVSERKVVEEEHRLDVENAPYGTVEEHVTAMLFPAGHPYAHTPIGIMSNLDSAVLQDVQAFHSEYYRPNDATLVLVGDFHSPGALALVRRYFGPIPAATKPFTRYPAIAADQTQERTETYTDRLAPLPLVVVAFRIPPAKSADTPVLDVMSYILSVGASSRLYQSLVRDQQMAAQVTGQPQSLLLGGSFYFAAVCNPGVSPQKLEQAILEQIHLLRSQPVSAAELQKAKNQAINAHVFGTTSTEQVASALGEADLLYGTPDEVNRYLGQLEAVTAADVQRVAEQTFAPELSNVIYVEPPAQPGAPSGPRRSQ